MIRPTFSIYQSMLIGHFILETPLAELKVTASPAGVMSVRPNNRDAVDEDQVLWGEAEITVRQKIISHLALAQEELAAYFRGELIRFTIPLDLRGTDFQRQVWGELQRIGYGNSCSYQDIAQRINRPKAARAVGAANGANPAAIIVPCHRVIGKNGRLTGYVHGVEMKKYLLDLEQSNGREVV